MRHKKRRPRVFTALTGPFLCITTIAAVSTYFSLPGRADDTSSSPVQHFNVQTPATLSPEEAEAIYRRVVDDMARAYILSQDVNAERYQQWPRYNTSPYQSATHGNRYINSYANALARDYDRLSEIDELPAGAVLAKDSFAVTDQGDVFLGPLFLMEKMEKGFDPEGRDWRYSMIMPDGSYFGRTGGDAEEQVVFCRTCHQAAGEENDHLFFVPPDVAREMK